MTFKPLKLKLYIAGNSPNSLIACKKLEAICADEFSLDSVEIEIIDLFKQPHRAHEDNVMLTPMLIIGSSPPVSIVGNLSDTQSIVNLIMSGGRENDGSQRRTQPPD